MATMISEVYDALRDAGATEQKARAAAEALAGYENRFVSIETKLAELRGHLKLVQWMLGFNLALTLSVLFKLFA